jgi:3-oxoadipate enol-lactonase
MVADYDSRLSLQGHGELVVLVPGINGTGDLFYRQIPRLERTFRVATYSLRDDAENIETLANDLSQIIETAAPADRRAIVVGESFGGAVALTLALRHPERVQRLVILNSFPHFAPQFSLKLAVAGLTILPWGAMPLVRHLTAFRLHSRHTHRADVKEFIRLTAHASRDGYINRLKILRRYDVRDRLHEITAPTLFLAAELDHLIPSVAQASYMASRVPLSVLKVLEGHGHICLIAPDIDLCQLLKEWPVAAPRE